MALKTIDQLTIDAPNPVKVTLELCIGSPSDAMAEPATVLVVSSDANAYVGGAGLIGAMASAGHPLGGLPAVGDFRPGLGATLRLATGIGAEIVVDWTPRLTGQSPETSAPYRTDDIFEAIQGFVGPAPVSIVIPFQTAPTKAPNRDTVFRELLRAAVKIGGWAQFMPTSIKIVLDADDAALRSAFRTVATALTGLMDPQSPPGNLPNSQGVPFGGAPRAYQNQTLTALSGKKAAGQSWPHNLTDLQAFCLTLYTTSYFAVMNKTLITADPAVKVPPGTVGYTDLNSANYIALMPIYAILSAALLNLPAFRAQTFRATGGWNPFAAQKKLRILSYMSSADRIPTQRFQNGTEQPWYTHPVHILTRSYTARDISFFSLHPWEREHLYDHGFSEHVTSNDVYPPTGKHRVLTVEIPKALEGWGT